MKSAIQVLVVAIIKIPGQTRGMQSLISTLDLASWNKKMFLKIFKLKITVIIPRKTTQQLFTVKLVPDVHTASKITALWVPGSAVYQLLLDLTPAIWTLGPHQ